MVLHQAIIEKFSIEGTPVSCEPYGNGHINSTHLVVCRQGERQHRYILQRINTSIFRDPERLMENIARVTGFLANMTGTCVCPKKQSWVNWFAK